jgi:adenosylhomocysteine nucleosidase
MSTRAPKLTPRKIALMSAMQEELAAVLHALPDKRCVHHAGREFWLGHWHGFEVVAVLARIGKVAAATTATALIERFGAQAIVFTGVAGGLGEGMRIGDVVIGSQFVQHDMDASPIFPALEVPLYGRSHFEADATWTAALHQAAQAVLAQPHAHLSAQAIDNFALHSAQVHQGLIASGDRFVSTAAESTTLRQRLPQALAVEMEGAAVAQVCYDYQTPFAAVRTISDRADDNAHIDFPRFIQDVASHYSLAVVERALRLVATT